MSSELNLASPDTSITVTIGGQPFSSSLDFTADPVAISLTGVVLEVKNTPVPEAPSTILVDEASDILVSVSSSPVENTIEISSTDLPSVSVSPVEIPEITVFDSQSLIFNLVDLDDIVGQPDDGDIIVFDGSTNTFIFDSNAGQGGSLSADVEVTNLDDALGDAVGMSYQEGASIQGIVRDILEPTKPFVYGYKLELECLGAETSQYVFKGAFFKLKSLRLYFDRHEALVAGSRVSVFYNDAEISASTIITSTPDPIVDIPFSSNLSWASSNDSDVLKVRIVYDSDGQYYEKRIPIYRVEPMALFATSLSDQQIIDAGDLAFVALRNTEGLDFDGGHTRSDRASVLSGSVNSESPLNHTVLAIPAEYTLDTISEITGGFGTADMTESFHLVSENTFKAFPSAQGVDEYNVYLYRSNQTGALKSKSSLRVKVS